MKCDKENFIMFRLTDFMMIFSEDDLRFGDEISEMVSD